MPPSQLSTTPGTLRYPGGGYYQRKDRDSVHKGTNSLVYCACKTCGAVDACWNDPPCCSLLLSLVIGRQVRPCDAGVTLLVQSRIAFLVRRSLCPSSLFLPPRLEVTWPSTKWNHDPGWYLPPAVMMWIVSASPVLLQRLVVETWHSLAFHTWPRHEACCVVL